MKNLRLLFIPLLLSGCFNLAGDATNTVIRQSSNRLHTHKAFLFLREGGATVADSYQISVLNYNDKFDTTAVGNTFVVDGDHGKAELNTESVDLKWLSDDSLLITYDGKLRQFLQKRKAEDITIIYKCK